MVFRTEKIKGLIYGAMIGDALGLPYEGLSRQGREKIFGEINNYDFIHNKGIVSDDTDHMLLSFFALANSSNSNDFITNLSKYLKYWLCCLPPGIGAGTLLAIIKLLFGVNPKDSGTSSAGNGPCMRSVAIGAMFYDDYDKITHYTISSSTITHKDKRSIVSAICVARLTSLAIRTPPQKSIKFKSIEQEMRAANIFNDPEWTTIIDRLNQSLKRKLNLTDFQNDLNAQNYVSGLSYQSIPIAIFCFAKYGKDFRSAVRCAVSCGGDTDTIGFITGALSGALLGVEALPRDLVHGLMSWPCDIEFAEEVISFLTEEKVNMPKSFPWGALLLRNQCCFLFLIPHIFRRAIYRLFRL